jgi:hypothetical protein
MTSVTFNGNYDFSFENVSAGWSDRVESYQPSQMVSGQRGSGQMSLSQIESNQTGSGKIGSDQIESGKMLLFRFCQIGCVSSV